MIRFNNRSRTASPVEKRHIGEIRKSQLISTFGIGSIVDFVKETVVIGGTDEWEQDDGAELRKIYNENLQSLLEVSYFLEPKTSGGKSYKAAKQDILSCVFPRKLYCPVCKSIIDWQELPEANKKSHQCNQLLDGKICRGALVASRFVVLCEKGHIEDFPYAWWVHSGSECPKGKKSPRILMYNIGDRSDPESLILECKECHQKRSLVGVFSKNALSGDNGYCCSGKHPHLGLDYRENCSAPVQVRLRSSSGIYFPVNYSALLIPPWSQNAMNLLEKKYDELSYMDEEKRAKYLRDKILPRCRNMNLDDLLNVFQKLEKQRENSFQRSEADIFFEEYRILCKDHITDDRFSSHFVEIPSDFTDYFESVSAVDRLVVTKALKGFTRLSPYDGNENRIVPLSRKSMSWIPAVELNGEGIFIRFKEDAIEKWKSRIGNRYDELKQTHDEAFFHNDNYSEKYVMLHTFSHLLIRQMSNECGYNTASMSERIYSDFCGTDGSSRMSGVLIYLSSSDSDGSLGGLVSIVEDTNLFVRVLTNMLREAKWCSGDPLCASSKHQGVASMNYAACHACTLLPETSCEFNNLLLDRVSVVGKIENSELGIMGELASSIM